MTAEISMESRVCASQDQMSAGDSGEYVILNLFEGAYFGLDGVGARIWELIQQPRTVGAIRDALMEEYDVETDVCERELRSFLAELADRKLIDLIPPES